MPIVIPDEIYSEEELMELWNERKVEDAKEFIPRTDREHLATLSRQPGQWYFIAFDEDTPVGYTGWTDNLAYIKTAGVYVAPSYRKGGSAPLAGGIANRLNLKRLTKLNKLSISILNNTEEGWVNSMKRIGWEEADEKPREIPDDDWKEYQEADLILMYRPSKVETSHNIFARTFYDIIKV